MMWFLLLLYVAHIEPVILQVTDEKRLILRNEKACEGHIEIYYDKTWGYIGDKYWNESTEEVVCRSTQCGTRVSSTDMQRPNDWPVWLNEVKCNGQESHLLDCEYPGWGVSTYRKPYVKKIKCSDEIKISLDGFQCAGAVTYSTNGAHSGYFCADNWGQTEADLLCESLGCGTSKEIPNYPLMVWKGFESSKKMIIKCSGIQNLNNLWQCVTEESSSCQKPASVICTGHQRLQLTGKKNACSGRLQKEENGSWNVVNSTSGLDVWCQQMYCGTYVSHTHSNGIELECTDKVKVDLRDNGKPTKCYGIVHTTVNDSSNPVCASEDWNKKNAEVVCRELNCGTVISTEKRSDPRGKGRMDYVNCIGSETSLWHCKAKRHNADFSCDQTAYVVCADSVKVRLKDGPGKCAGRVEIQHKGQWKRIAKEGWTEANSNVVCKKLGCEKELQPTNPDKFSEGSGDFLDKIFSCKSKRKISECITEDTIDTKEKKAIGITCEEHKVVFLDEDKGESCSGTVGIVKGKETYWLSGSHKTWNNESANAVCRQMHCGKASHHGFLNSSLNADMKKLWHYSYNCSSNAASLFECETMEEPPDHNNSNIIATVNCSERIKVNLTDGCWGDVNVCANGKCGGVCADAWTDQKSVMLCKNLGCGDTVLPNLPTTSKRLKDLIFLSLHTTEHTKNLSQCNFVKYDERSQTFNKRLASVICSGSVKPRINAARDKCSGNVEVYYGGQWLPVSTGALKDNKTLDMICGELKCGKAVNKIGYFGPVTEVKPVISQIQCNDDGSLAACNISYDDTKTLSSSSYSGLQCSSWSKMELKISERTCSGEVFVRSEGKLSAVSTEGWTGTEGKQLCQNLNCGNSVKFLNKTIASDSLFHRSFNCTGVANPESSIWDCEKETSPSQKQQLYIDCKDEPDVTLSDTCHGNVKIDNVQVCASSWNNDYSHLICQERDCSNAIADTFSGENANPDLDYYHVSCEKYHYKLDQCKRFKGRCNGKLVAVSCVGSVKFGTTTKCGGQIKVTYGGKVKKVCPSTLSKEFQEKLCRNLNCGAYNSSIRKSNQKKTENLEITLTFTEAHKDIKHSVQPVSCGSAQPAEIYCNGYVNVDPTTPPPQSPPNIVPIILGVGFFLILVILIVVFIRIYIVKKAQNAINVSSRMSSRKEVEFESGDYEDVTSKANEMEDFNRGRFSSEAEVIMESDARSTTSFPYDDIDEAAEAQPLTSQAATAGGASGDNCIHEGAFDQSADGVTYEVDDPQENYDDIEASPEITQTTAEVHHRPQTTPESVTAAPIGLVQGDEGYLVPDQDR